MARPDTIAYAIGLLGFWSRLAVLQLGASAITELVSQDGTSSSEPTIEKLIDHYELLKVRPAKQPFSDYW